KDGLPPRRLSLRRLRPERRRPRCPLHASIAAVRCIPPASARLLPRTPACRACPPGLCFDRSCTVLPLLIRLLDFLLLLLNLTLRLLLLDLVILHRVADRKTADSAERAADCGACARRSDRSSDNRTGG